jgi:beta-lactam-binding protein with PASTA domain
MTLGLVALLLLAAVLAGCSGGREEGAEVVVPDLIGMNTFEAQQVLAREGLRWRWGDGVEPGPTNGFFLADTIYAQAPAIDRKVPRGTVVMLVPASPRLVALRVP